MAAAPPESRTAPEFQPARPAASRTRRLGYLLGAVIWVVALIALALALDQTDAVGVAVAIVAVSILAGVASSTLMRRARVRDEGRS